MISHGYATGHGDSVEGLLGELEERILRDNDRFAEEIGSLRNENDAFVGQLSLRDKRDADMQEMMRINNALLADIARKDEALRKIADTPPALLPQQLVDRFIDVRLTARAALHPLAPVSKSLGDEADSCAIIAKTMRGIEEYSLPERDRVVEGEFAESNARADVWWESLSAEERKKARDDAIQSLAKRSSPGSKGDAS